MATITRCNTVLIDEFNLKLLGCRQLLCKREGKASLSPCGLGAEGGRSVGLSVGSSNYHYPCASALHTAARLPSIQNVGRPIFSAGMTNTHGVSAKNG